MSSRAADLLVSMELRSEVCCCCSTSTLRDAIALTVSASSSDWPCAALGASDSEWVLVWDKLWRQGQCLPGRTARFEHSLYFWKYFLHGGGGFLPWISITLSSEAQAFGHGFSWGHWNVESDYRQINEVIKTFIYSKSKRIITKLWLTYIFCCNVLLTACPEYPYILLPIRTTGVLYIPPHFCGIGPSKCTLQ